MRGAAADARPEPHDGTPLLPRPSLGLGNQRTADTLTPVRPIDNEPADNDERIRLDILEHRGVEPAGRVPVDFGNQQPLIRPCQNARKPSRERLGIDVVSELRRQMGDRGRVRDSSSTYGNSHRNR